MSIRPQVGNALQELGQRSAAEAGVAGEAPEPKSAGSRRRFLSRPTARYLLLALVLAAVAAGVSWQRERLRGYAARIPLLGPLISPRPGAAPVDADKAALAQQEQDLLRREQEIQKERAQLTADQAALAAREKALAEREAKLAAREKQVQAQTPGPGTDRLVAIYQNMKPDAAAPLVAKLDNLTAVTILSRLENEQAARILAAMDQDRAAELSRALAAQGGG